LRIARNDASSSTRNAHSSSVTWCVASSTAAPAPSSGGVTYPANAVSTIPGPDPRPRDTVSPDVSECSRIPSSRRPLSTETSACPPSCAIVIAFRARCQPRTSSTIASATSPLTATTHAGGTGWVPVSRSHSNDIPTG